MTVFVVNRPRPGPKGFTYDISPAYEYGDVVFVFDELMPYRDPQQAEREAWEALKDFDTAEDYILWAGGDPCGLIIASAVVAKVTDGVFRWLKWDRLRDEETRKVVGGRYVPIPLVV